MNKHGGRMIAPGIMKPTAATPASELVGSTQVFFTIPAAALSGGSSVTLQLNGHSGSGEYQRFFFFYPDGTFYWETYNSGGGFVAAGYYTNEWVSSGATATVGNDYEVSGDGITWQVISQMRSFNVIQGDIQFSIRAAGGGPTLVSGLYSN